LGLSVPGWGPGHDADAEGRFPAVPYAYASVRSAAGTAGHLHFSIVEKVAARPL
jgi:hypothetical protein